MSRIDTISGRNKLPSRPAPYFVRLSKGRFLGYRKLVATESWVGRYHPEEGKPINKTLGELTDERGYDKAVEEARAWFAELDSGVTGKTEDGTEVTVEVACRRYIEDRRKNKSEGCAHDADKRFERTVYGNDKYPANPIAKIKLAKFRSAQFSTWRNSLERLSKASANRTATTLRAALLLAVNEGIAGPHVIVELRKVRQHKNAGKRRDLYLDRFQRRSLIDACEGGLRDLIEAAALTGARAGELTHALVKHFDPRRKVLLVKGPAGEGGKTGYRPMLISPAAIEFFSRRCQGCEPDDFLLTRDDGRHWSHSDWDEEVKAAAKRAELPPETVLYTLRHSWITEALMGGMSTLEVARIVGTSLAMIQAHYGHLVSDAAQERLSKIEMV
jgi:integrase